ncbi:MAG: hypothetical protein ABI353_23090 [Isosphaeraceae bacterium]
MSTAEMRFQPLIRLLRELLAPLVWLERARGRKRLALACLYVLVIAVAGVLSWRGSRIRGLPDIGDPFDPGPLLDFSVADDRNAFVPYRRASERATRNREIESRIFNAPYAWPKSDPEALAYLAENAEALELWRQGTERPEALYYRASEMTFDTALPIVQDHRHFARMAMMEAMRLRGEGDQAGAWIWYRAVLRGSRHVGNQGTVIGRLVGINEYAFARSAITAWAADPTVDAALLRRVLKDVQNINVMTGPDSISIQYEYTSMMRTLENSDRLAAFYLSNPDTDGILDRGTWYYHLPGYFRARWFLEHEPERTRRIAKLAFANWLAQCDRPPRLRPLMIGTRKTPRLVYDAPVALPTGLSMPAAELARLLESSWLARSSILNYEAFEGAFGRDRAQQSGLVVALANRLYEVERGAFPESLGDLIGPYLDRLPEGYISDDPPLENGTP